MQRNELEVLTQEELVERLRELSYRDASMTRVAHWRKLGLLPPFDSAGHGRGRGAGRVKAFWTNPTKVMRSFLAFRERIAPEMAVSYGPKKQDLTVVGPSWGTWWRGLAWKPVYSAAARATQSKIKGSQKAAS